MGISVFLATWKFDDWHSWRHPPAPQRLFLWTTSPVLLNFDIPHPPETSLRTKSGSPPGKVIAEANLRRGKTIEGGSIFLSEMSTDLEAQRMQEPESSVAVLPDFDVPHGLRFLLRTTQIRVYRVPIEGENKCCSAFPRKFYVADGEGNPILEGVESSSWCARLCAESSHAFEVDFRDADGATVLSMEKTAGCSAFYCCNAPAISVVSGSDNYGTVLQSGILPRTRLTLLDGIERPQLRLLGPCARQSRYIDGIFKLKCFSERGSLGRLTVQHFAGMDSYQIYFPVDLDLRMKCLLIASAVLLDCIFA
ncbi:phospholipid scramblase 3 [Echinococcus multilocularis]|uniref:Phospholipid scramblase n=1 Tax=Echinococcus multilocularis TaxID=6211 RepID=A0A068Y924_ECHMU|nr:phospholipid scramblase 3 [Echinococcus multilocularis]